VKYGGGSMISRSSKSGKKVWVGATNHKF